MAEREAELQEQIRDLHVQLEDVRDKTKFFALQWRGIVETARKANAGTDMVRIPMADVSGSMEWAADGAPMRASVALSLLLMDVNPAPWEGVVLTFDSEPRLLDFGPRPTGKVPRDIGRLASAEASAEASSDDLSNNSDKDDHGEDYGSDSTLIERDEFSNSEESGDEAHVVSETSSRAASETVSQIWQTAYEETKARFRKAGLGEGPGIVFWNSARRRGCASMACAKWFAMAKLRPVALSCIPLFVGANFACSPCSPSRRAEEACKPSRTAVCCSLCRSSISRMRWVRDAACPISTEGGTRRVHLVRRGGGGGGVE